MTDELKNKLEYNFWELWDQSQKDHESIYDEPAERFEELYLKDLLYALVKQLRKDMKLESIKNS